MPYKSSSDILIRNLLPDDISIITDWPSYQACFKELDYALRKRGWLSENDFKPVRLELIIKDIKYAGEESFKGWLRTTWFPFTDRLPESLKETFLDEVSEVYKINHPVDKFGNIHVKMIRLEVEAYAV